MSGLDTNARKRLSFADFFRWSAVKSHALKALDQPDAPVRLALSFSVGIFCGILPFPGHTLVVTVLAFAFRLNLFAAIAGAWVNFPLIIPFTYSFAFFVGELVTGTDIPSIAWSRIVNVSYWWPLFRAYFVPMATGTTIVGTLWAVASYFVTLRIARRLRAQRLRQASKYENVRSSQRFTVSGKVYET